MPSPQLFDLIPEITNSQGIFFEVNFTLLEL